MKGLGGLLDRWRVLLSDMGSLSTARRDCCSVMDGVIRQPSGGLSLLVQPGSAELDRRQPSSILAPFAGRLAAG
jgi:hypothetical protein